MARGRSPRQREELLSVDDVCSELDIARSTLYDWRQKRKGPKTIRLPNGSLRVRRSDLTAWLENLREAS